jgi:hypothetical protein
MAHTLRIDALAVHLHGAAVHVQQQRLQAPAGGVRLAADRHQDLVGRQVHRLARGVLHVQRVAQVIETVHRMAQVQLDAQLVDRRENGPGQFLVIGRQDAILRLHDEHLGAQLAVRHAQLEADVAGADHRQRRRHLGEGERLGGRDHAAAEPHHRQLHRVGARGQQQVLAGDAHAGRGGAGGRHVDGLAVDERGPALDDLHAVLLQQRAHAAGELADDAVLPLHRLGEIDGRRFDLDADLRVAGPVGGLLESRGRVDDGLRRDAAHVEAGAAQALAFDEHRGNAQLAGADGGDVAAGAPADHDEGR